MPNLVVGICKGFVAVIGTNTIERQPRNYFVPGGGSDGKGSENGAKGISSRRCYISAVGSSWRSMTLTRI